MTWLLDTNVISETAKPKPHANVRAWLKAQPGTSLYLSVLTLGELAKGIESVRQRDRAKAVALDRWFAKVMARHRGHILPVDRSIAERWGRLPNVGQMEAVDGLLAATAIVFNLTLVTRNVSDFAGVGVRTHNPFTPVI